MIDNIPQNPKTAATRVRRAEMLKDRYEQVIIEDRINHAIEYAQRGKSSYGEESDPDFASSNENLPPDVRKQQRKVERKQWNDVEPAWRSQDPRKRISWPEFCRDFMGQNYGAIAQDLMMMHGSDDPALRVQFLKFMMEMGKQGNPASLQLDINAKVQANCEIYSQLDEMNKLSNPDCSLIEDQQAEEANLLPEGSGYEDQSPTDEDDASASTSKPWHSLRTVDDQWQDNAEQYIDPEIIPCENEQNQEQSNHDQ